MPSEDCHHPKSVHSRSGNKNKNVRDGNNPRKRLALQSKGPLSRYTKNRNQGTHNPDSATMVLTSLAIYCTGVPVGGIARSWTRNLTTSVSHEHGGDKGSRDVHHLMDNTKASMQSPPSTHWPGGPTLAGHSHTSRRTSVSKTQRRCKTYRKDNLCVKPSSEQWETYPACAEISLATVT